MKQALLLLVLIQVTFAQEDLVWVRDDRVLNPSGVQIRSLPEPGDQPVPFGNARIDLGDVDGDGHLDLVMLDNAGLQFYRNLGAPNFDQFERRPDWEIGVDVTGIQYNTIPTLADLNYDLHPELIIPDPTIRVWRNVGAGGTVIWFRDDALLEGISGRQVLAVVDLFNDAVFDVVTRCPDSGDVCIYRNIGSPESSFWELLPTTLRDVIDPEVQFISFFQSVRFADMDNDGDADLLVTETVPIAFAHLFIFENATSSGTLFFREFRNPVSLNGLEGMNPAPGDLDKSGTIDMVVGDNSFFLSFYRNAGTPAQMNFVAPVLWGAPRAFLETDPAIGDLDRDGDLDLILAGAIEPTDILPAFSQINFFRNVGDAKSFRWQQKEVIFYDPFENAHLRPTFNLNDYNQDGELDLAVGAHLVDGDLFEYTLRGTAITFLKKVPGGLAPQWEEDPSVFAQFVHDSIYYDPILFDFNGDGALDLLMQVAGEYTFYENIGPLENPNWEARPPWLDGLDERRHHRAAAGDADKDGLPDLLFGELDGGLNFYRNVGAASLPKWQLTNSAFAGIRVDSSAAPAFGDLDGDGDLDLIIGDAEGKVVLYRNDLIVGVESVNTNFPESFILKQNYPNPFNPETTIEYELAQPGFARLTIYNLLGQRVRTLVDSWQPAGRHRVSWDRSGERGADSVASGVYLYELKIGEMVQRKKMVLLH